MAILSKHVVMGKNIIASGSLAGEMKVAAISGSTGLTLNQMLIKLDDNASATDAAYAAADAAQLVALKGDVQSSYDTLGKLEDYIIALQADVDQNESDSDSAEGTLTSNLSSLSSSAKVDRALVRTEFASADAAQLVAIKGDVQSSYDTLGKLEDYIIALQADVDQNESDSDSAEGTISTNLSNLSGAFDGRFNVINGSGNGSITKAINDLIDLAPGALNTLNELAAAIGDDANYAATVTTAIAAVQTDVNNNEAVSDSVIGMSGGSHMGTFTASIISDNGTIKAALQELETRLAAAQVDVDQNESDADAAIAANEVHIDHAVTLSGVAKDADHLGSFTGDTISSTATVKAALQAVETQVEVVVNNGFHTEKDGVVWKMGWGVNAPRLSFEIEADASVTMSVDKETA